MMQVETASEPIVNREQALDWLRTMMLIRRFEERAEMMYQKGNKIGGFLAAVFMYTGWDGTVYVNEETKHRRVNPGRAAMMAVIALAIIFTFVTVGLQGVISANKLTIAGNNEVALITVARAIGGAGWEKVMALSLALSVLASTGTGISFKAKAG